MKKAILFSLLLLISYNYVLSQGNYLRIPDYIDMKCIDSIIKSKTNNNVLEYMVFQCEHSFSNNDKVKPYLQTLSFVIWKQNKKNFIKIIGDDFVSQDLLLIKNFVFSSKFVEKLGARVNENSLSFTPPILNTYKNNVFIVFSKNSKFFFESGNVSNYDEKYEAVDFKRKKFVSKLKKELVQYLPKVKKEISYLRSE